MFNVALGVPCNFHWFSAGDSSSQVGMGDLVKPWFEVVVVRTSLYSVEGAVDRQEAVVKGG